MPAPPIMEIDSDSSSDSVIITGPIPDYPELKKRTQRPATPPRNGKRKNTQDPDISSLDEKEKVGKIQELEDLVNATASLPRAVEIRDDEDDAWSGSDTKSAKGKWDRHSSSKYLKKIKTLQQNKRRQETRISKLSREVKSLRDKNSVQAAYIDVLCGMLGEDMKEKFRDKQGLGILGNLKTAEENYDVGPPEELNDDVSWRPGTSGESLKTRDDCNMAAKEREYYCVEDLDEISDKSAGRDIVREDLLGSAAGGKKYDEDLARPLDEIMPIESPRARYNVTAINGVEATAHLIEDPLTISVASASESSIGKKKDGMSAGCKHEGSNQMDVASGADGNMPFAIEDKLEDTVEVKDEGEGFGKQQETLLPDGDGFQLVDQSIYKGIHNMVKPGQLEVEIHKEDNEIDCEKYLEQTLNELEQCSDKFDETAVSGYEPHDEIKEGFEDGQISGDALEDRPTTASQEKELLANGGCPAESLVLADQLPSSTGISALKTQLSPPKVEESRDVAQIENMMKSMSYVLPDFTSEIHMD